MFLASGGTDTIVTGPSPNTWYARLTSPLRAYRVGGTCCTSPVEHPTSQVARPLECVFAAPADGPRQAGADARHRKPLRRALTISDPRSGLRTWRVVRAAARLRE